MNKSTLVLLLLSLLSSVTSTEPNPPQWPDSVKIFDPSDPNVQQVVDSIFATQGGNNPPLNGQWSDLRYALLFKPGQYNVNVNLGYYTHLMGLGQSPYQVQLESVSVQNGDFNFQVGALDNFWRIAENFYTRPTQSWNSVGNTMMWAVSQACPLRRAVIDGNLQLYQYNYGGAAGYASGGYMADVQVANAIFSGSQQQFILRNTKMDQWVGASWNYVFVGSQGGPGSNCQPGSYQSSINVAQTPVIAEKPFIVFDNQRYYLAIPNLKTSSSGPSNYDDTQRVDFNQVFVATKDDSVETINQKLASGLHLVLTPGQYQLSGSIIVTNPNTVVLGLGLATLISSNGKPCIVVKNVEGVKISGLLLQAGPYLTPTLLQWGEGSYEGNPANPGILQDLFTRVGGTNDPQDYQVYTDRMVTINSGNVILDDLWLWRADHSIVGSTQNSQNPTNVGIEVNGNNVIAYGLASEHTLQNLVEWNGENGQVYFYQSELPYDVTQANYGDKGYVSYKVNSSVNSHKAFGIGVYSFFEYNDVVVETGISVPVKPGVTVYNALSVFLNGYGGIRSIINGLGDSAFGPTFNIHFYCLAQGSKTKGFLQ